MIEFLFLDLDDTILDFHKAERIGLDKTFRQFGIEPDEALLKIYHDINIRCWQRLEEGTMTRQEVVVGRFEILFSQLGMDADPLAFSKAYEHNLAQGHFFLPGAEEAVKALSKKYRLFLASNGTASVHKGLMTSANLYPYFEQVFVSQDIGYNKPAREYFQGCFDRIPDFDPNKAMIVGDSLTSDILGGIRAGIRTCWVNPEHSPAREDIPADFQIESITQLEALLEAL